MGAAAAGGPGALPALLSSAIARGEAPALRIHGEAGWAQVSWRQFGVMAAAAAVRAAAGFRDGAPAIVLVDNTVESLAALAGLAAAGIDLALLEGGSSLLHDEASVLHGLGAVTVVGLADPPGRYRALAPAALTLPMPGLDATAELAALPGADSAVWQSTSGSTGEPRFARQTVASLVRGGFTYMTRYQVTERDRLLVTVPMAHSFGLVGGLMCALASGAPVTAFTTYSPRAAREAIESGATVMLGTPLVYELMTRTARPAATTLRVALSSGGPLAPAAAESAQGRTGCPVYQVYGSTETGIIASQYPRPQPWPASSVGTPAPGVELRLAGGPAAGEEAELHVRTATMFDRYLGSAEPALDADGWYRTGDTATVDEANCLTLVRRKDSFINVGGRKVNPVRVERLIGGHQAVAEVAVYGIETVGGDEIRAAVAFSAPCTAEELLAFCRTRLAPYEVPLQLHVVDHLPRNGMGKVDRSRLPR